MLFQGLEVSSKAYSGPQVASKYTYDNGEAPFSASWTASPSQAKAKARAKAKATTAAKDGQENTAKVPASPPVFSSAPSSGAPASDRNETIPRAAGPAAEPAALREGNISSGAVSKSGGGGGGGVGGGGPSHAAAAAAAVAARAKAAAAVGPGSIQSTAVSPESTGTIPLGAAAAQRKPTPGPAAVAAASVRRAPNANGVAGKGFSGGSTSRRSEQVPATRTTSSAAQNKGSSTSEVSPAAAAAAAAAGRDQAPPGDGGGDAAFHKLRLEVAKLRTHLVINRAALARVESMGGQTAGAGAGAGLPAARGGRGGAKSDDKARKDDERRDTALRKLTREVAELRRELSGMDEKLSDAVGTRTPPAGTRGGDSEAVLKLKREVVELRAQLENARKETALTRSALRRLQGDVDGLRKAVASR